MLFDLIVVTKRKRKDFSSIIKNFFILSNQTNDIKCNIPLSTVFIHGAIGTVISKYAKLGKHCIISHNVTIGVRHRGYPVLENYVIVRGNAVIIGAIRIGHHSIIGAGSVVLHDVDPYSVVVGNPAKCVKKITDEEYKNYQYGE